MNTNISVLSVVIPVYNERRWIEPLIGRVQAVSLNNIRKEIVIVDDGSNDGTTEFLQKFVQGKTSNSATDPLSSKTYSLDPESCKYISLGENHGKGHACRKGFAASTGDVVLIQDADLEFAPKNYPDLIRPIKEENADAVFGSRFFNKNISTVSGFPMFANKIFTTSFNLLAGTNLTDVTTGHKLLTRETLDKLFLESDGFGLDLEIPSKLAKKNMIIREIQIEGYRRRSYKEGKKFTWNDALWLCYQILKHNLPTSVL